MLPLGDEDTAFICDASGLPTPEGRPGNDQCAVGDAPISPELLSQNQSLPSAPVVQILLNLNEIKPNQNWILGRLSIANIY